MDVPAAKKPLYTSTVEVPPLAETKPGPSADDAFDPVVQEEKRLEKRKARKARERTKPFQQFQLSTINCQCFTQGDCEQLKRQPTWFLDL